jgi:hypothetical protein
MPITTSEIIDKLDDNWKKFLVVEADDIIEISVDTLKYKNSLGSLSIPIVFKIEEEGRYLKVVVPNYFEINPNEKNYFFLKKLLKICWETKLVQFELNPKNGEVRAIIEVAVEDGTLTSTQIKRIVDTLLTVSDYYFDDLYRTLSHIDAAVEDRIDTDTITKLNRIFNSEIDQKIKKY